MTNTLESKSLTGGVAESGYYPAVVEMARVVNVNVVDYTVDCVGEYGEKKFFDIQIMSPYLHFVNGEGVYIMPEVGCTVWICTPSTGLMAQPFVLGFGSVVDERQGVGSGAQAVNYRATRQSLNPGDIMLRTRDENFIALRRGGVIQIGTTPTAQRFYIPLGNLIRDVCENYLLESFAGDMRFSVERTDQTDSGQVQTYFSLNTRSAANDVRPSFSVRAGAHVDDQATKLTMVINNNGTDQQVRVATLTITNTGAVNWTIEDALTYVARQGISFTSQEGNILLEAILGTMTLTSEGDMSLTTNMALALQATNDMSVQAANVSVSAVGPNGQGPGTIAHNGNVQTGGVGGQPHVLGQELVTLLTELLTTLSSSAGVTGGPGSPIALTAVAPFIPRIQNIMSQTNTVT